MLGPSIGFFIIGPAYDRFAPLFWATLLIGFGTLALMLFVRDRDEDGADASAAGRTAGGQNTGKRIRWLVVLLPIFVLFLNALSQSAIVSFLALYAISLSFTGVGSFFSVNAVGMITSRFIMNRLVRRFGAFPMIILNTVIFGLSILLLTRVKSMFRLLLLAFPRPRYRIRAGFHRMGHRGFADPDARPARMNRVGARTMSIDLMF